MSVSFELDAAIRDDKGKGASRRLRRAGKIPAIMYGGNADPVSLVLDHAKVMHHLEHEAFYSHILSINLDGKVVQAVLKDLQRHTHKPGVLHLDLLRISKGEKLRMQVPLHFLGEDNAPGVKQAGGVVSHLLTDVEVACLPGNLPEYIEVDISSMEAGESLHLTDIKLPEGVELVSLTQGAEHDVPVIAIHLPRGSAESGEEEAGAAGTEEGGGEEA